MDDEERGEGWSARGDGWTVATLKQHFEQRFLDADKGISAALAAAEKANSKEEVNSKQWRESANEWRGAMQDREVKFAMRSEVEQEFKAVRAEIAGLKESRAEGLGSKSVVAVIVSTVIAALLMWAGLHFGR